MASIDELKAEHGAETVQQAFWLQEHIYEDGIRGIDFTGDAERKMNEVKQPLVKSEIESQLRSSY
jgi:hypothetical protein